MPQSRLSAVTISLSQNASGDDLREQTHAFFSESEQPLWRLSVPTVAPPLALPGEQMVEWVVRNVGLKTSAEAAAIRAAATAAGGHDAVQRW
jgi:glycolate oxidase FAD binding subunit